MAYVSSIAWLLSWGGFFSRTAAKKCDELADYCTIITNWFDTQTVLHERAARYHAARRAKAERLGWLCAPTIMGNLED